MNDHVYLHSDIVYIEEKVSTTKNTSFIYQSILATENKEEEEIENTRKVVRSAKLSTNIKKHVRLRYTWKPKRVPRLGAQTEKSHYYWFVKSKSFSLSPLWMIKSEEKYSTSNRKAYRCIFIMSVTRLGQWKMWLIKTNSRVCRFIN